MEPFVERFVSDLEFSVREKMKSGGRNYNQLDLFKTKGMKRITAINLTQWFSTKMVYYGLSLGKGLK